MAFLTGATLATTEIAQWQYLFPQSQWMKVEPDSTGLPPSWDDPRLIYLKNRVDIPFLVVRTGGDAAKVEALRLHLVNMPTWAPRIYLTEHPSPERDLSSSAYRANFTAVWTMVQALPPTIRAKVFCGPVLNRAWTEDQPGRTYHSYDPGTGDFFGIEIVVDPDDGTGTLRTGYPSPVTMLAGLKTYRQSPTDIRPRVIPTVASIGLPADTANGAALAAWIAAFFIEVAGWTIAAQGWRFDGLIWQNTQGPSGPYLTGIGVARYWHLDRKQSPTGYTLYGTPDPLNTFNAQSAAYWNAAPPPALPESAPQPNDTPPAAPTDPGEPDAPVVPPTSLPLSAVAAARLLRADYTVLITDANLNILGDPVDEWTTLQATIRWKEPSSGQITVPAHGYVRQMLQPGCRIVIIRRILGTQHVLAAGPLEKRLRERADNGENGGVGMMTLTFVDDMGWLGARLTYPNPALVPESQTTDYWEYTGNPEQAMLQLVNTQAGPGALPDRRVPKLVVAGFSGISGTGTVKLGPTSDVNPRERLEKVTDVLRKICTLGANPTGVPAVHHPDSLGFRTRQTRVGGQDVILFEPLRSRDLSGEVHFSFGLGNLEYYAYEENAPTLTHPIVGGSGEGADRFIRELPTDDADQTAWGRFEGYVPRPGTDTLAEMQDASREALAEARQSARLASNASDTADQRYGAHYDVGDIVSIELDEGEYVVAPVQTVNLQAWPTAGEVVGTTIGDQSARYDSPWIKRQREFDRRISRLERGF